MLLAAIPASWLVADHYYPWLSAWQEGAALALMALAAMAHRAAGRLPAAWAAALAVALLSAVAQWLSGHLLYGGDALMTALYLGVFAGAMVMGSSLPVQPTALRLPALEWLAAGTVAGAIASVGVALSQWTAVHGFFIAGVTLPPGGRPSGNVAQPNHLCTIIFLGLCSLAYLREARRVGRLGFWAGAAFLVLGMVMSGSRTGWLQAGALLALVLATQDRAALRVRAASVLGLLAIYVALTLAWPAINDALLLSGNRAVGEQLQGGVRFPLWMAMFDAIGRQPLWGYGWQQVASAQIAVAVDHPAVYYLFEHSHNLVLDLLLWAGVPVGGTIIALAAWALWRQLRALTDARAVWLMAGVLGVLMHAMLEYPLEYAYFLIPTGLALGAAHALCPGQPAVSVPAAASRAAWLVASVLLGAVAVEYLQAEQNHRLLRLESAHIGTLRIESQSPGLHLLTQLEAFLAFARTEARPGMAAEEVASMRRVAQRFGYPPVMFRYALAAGLNGDPKAAQQTLAAICRIHSRLRCQEGRDNWKLLQVRYPVLTAVQVP
jgi:O-antigen ligase